MHSRGLSKSSPPVMSENNSKSQSEKLKKKKRFFPFLHVPLLFNAVILLPRKPPLVCSPWCAPTGYTLKDESPLIDRRLRMAWSSACSSHLNVTSLI